ncbi:MAG: NAD(P)H-dependent oxidoreductase [Deltaproteobacteria bacterium]|jgi:FMN-dependent NADH-azoreductase|nr:NAD(P)H-dependent oxidoreductase [Deltaproteobacteria bacterium]
MKLLYIQASPRKAKSHCLAIGDALAEAWQRYNPEATITRRNVFETAMPEADYDAVEARYLTLSGQPVPEGTEESWRQAEAEALNFASHDRYIIATPMWNYHLPYKLKHYLDLIFQPGITVRASASYDQAVKSKRVCFVLSRGGMYSPGSPLDFQRPYLAHLFDRLGFTSANLHWLIIEPTADTPQNIKDLHTIKIAEALTLAKEF